MKTKEAPSYSSSRVQRASRLNALEQARLSHRLLLLEKARLHQSRLANQDIRLASLALDYIQACSGHSPEGRGPNGQQGGCSGPDQHEDPYYLYGERVLSRKVKRTARPHSAVERSSFRRDAGGYDRSNTASPDNGEDSRNVMGSLPPRPHSSPTRRRAWACSSSDETGGSVGSDLDSERPLSKLSISSRSRAFATSLAGHAERDSGRAVSPQSGRLTPHQLWEDDTDGVTLKLLKAKKQREEYEEQINASLRRSSSRYNFNRMLSQSRSSSLDARAQSRRTSSTSTSNANCPASAQPPTAPAASGNAEFQDRKPVSPSEKHAQSDAVNVSGRRPGLMDILNQSSATKSSPVSRAHMSRTQLAPSVLESHRQLIMEARRNIEKERQKFVQQRVDSFIGKTGRKSP